MVEIEWNFSANQIGGMWHVNIRTRAAGAEVSKQCGELVLSPTEMGDLRRRMPGSASVSWTVHET